jgi:hypothetical protein
MDNVLELKEHLNLPFSINIGANEYKLKILSVADIFELLEHIQNIQLKEELKSTKELLELNDKATKELLVELKAKQQKITFSNFDEIFKYVLANISLKDIINILSWAINKFNSGKSGGISSIKDELNDHINNDNFSEYINSILKILGIPTSSTENEEAVEEVKEGEEDLNATKDVSLNVKKK